GHREMPFFPVPLADISPAGKESVPALAEWVVESLEVAWRNLQHEQAQSEIIAEPEKPVRGRPKRQRSKVPDTSPYRGAEIAAALASGDQALARTLVKTAIAEVDAPVDLLLAARCARTVALASATLEAAERARTDTTDAWAQFPAFLSTVRSALSDTDLAKAAMALFAPIVPRRQQRPADNVLLELDRMVMGRMPDSVQLGEIAQRLGKHPTAITHHLQRKYGLSFTQYVGRLRIDKAKELLRRTRLGVGEVAARVGIADQSNFTKLFRKFEGISPLQYREQYRAHR
ncbi:MAG TPA: helix-turn-helix transcriptional regulator, partial [Candidatus Hydrogenedentes bacterium]|nr:helix-turn-helix transcriptional regulator [Candidatus Hydrogenedentota bacterium]